jgi:hypothetical protein
MSESILISIKKLLGIAAENTDFDQDIIIHINSVFMVLRQLGIGPVEGFRIEDKNTTWDEFIEDDSYFDTVKSYMYFKVKIMFDPPTNSTVMESTNRLINELEWRLNVDAETRQ